MNNTDIVQKVNDALLIASSAKNRAFKSYAKIKADLDQMPIKTQKSGIINYHRNALFIASRSKLSKFTAIRPEYDFYCLDNEKVAQVNLLKQFYDFIWNTSNTDSALFRIYYDAVNFGTGWGFENIVKEVRKVKVPYKDKATGELYYEEKEIVDYEGPRLEYIPFENIFVLGTDIDKVVKGGFVTHMDRKQFLQYYGNNPQYTFDPDDISCGRYYYITLNQSTSITEMSLPGSSGTPGLGDKDIVSVLHFFDEPNDEWIVLANGVWINPTKGGGISPIPFAHKKFPLVAFTEYYLPGNVYGIGDGELTMSTRELMDDTRSMLMNVAEKSLGLMCVDKSAGDVDMSTIKFGLNATASVNKEDIFFIQPQIQTSGLQALLASADNDLIDETGNDFRNLRLDSSETATLTDSKKESTRDIVNLTFKFNAFSFFNKLAQLRLANMRMWYKDQDVNIPTYGESTEKDGTSYYQGQTYGVTTIDKSIFDLDIGFMIRMDSLVGNTTEREKQNFLQEFQLINSVKNPSTGQIDDLSKKLLIAGKRFLKTDVDSIIGDTPSAKSPEDIARDITGEKNMMSEDVNNPNFIPPEQRSTRQSFMPSQPNLG